MTQVAARYYYGFNTRPKRPAGLIQFGLIITCKAGWPLRVSVRPGSEGVRLVIIQTLSLRSHYFPFSKGWTHLGNDDIQH